MTMSTENIGMSLTERQCGSEMKEGILRPTASAALDLIRTKLEDPNFDAQWSQIHMIDLDNYRRRAYDSLGVEVQNKTRILEEEGTVGRVVGPGILTGMCRRPKVAESGHRRASR